MGRRVGVNGYRKFGPYPVFEPRTVEPVAGALGASLSVLLRSAAPVWVLAPALTVGTNLR